MAFIWIWMVCWTWCIWNCCMLQNCCICSWCNMCCCIIASCRAVPRVDICLSTTLITSCNPSIVFKIEPLLQFVEHLVFTDLPGLAYLKFLLEEVFAVCTHWWYDWWHNGSSILRCITSCWNRSECIDGSWLNGEIIQSLAFWDSHWRYHESEQFKYYFT